MIHTEHIEPNVHIIYKVRKEHTEHIVSIVLMVSKVYTIHTEHIIHTVSIVPAEHIELNVHAEYIDHTDIMNILNLRNI